MTAEEVFEIWAPHAAQWSRWAKPVLFAHIREDVDDSLDAFEFPSPAYDLSHLPRADGATAIVADLAGAEGVLLGLQLAMIGYRPVPLYNSVPAPTAEMSMFGRPGAMVDMSEVVGALRRGTTQLSTARLAFNAAPAFLLDARRRTGDGTLAPMPGTFDNRSVSLPTDFPSGNRLLAGGIRRALLVQHRDQQPQPDLSHTLRRWQEIGLEILVWNLTAEDGMRSPPHPVVVGRPPWYRHLWHALRSRIGLRQNPLGGFGGFLPVPSSG